MKRIFYLNLCLVLLALFLTACAIPKKIGSIYTGSGYIAKEGYFELNYDTNIWNFSEDLIMKTKENLYLQLRSNTSRVFCELHYDTYTIKPIDFTNRFISTQNSSKNNSDFLIADINYITINEKQFEKYTLEGKSRLVPMIVEIYIRSSDAGTISIVSFCPKQMYKTHKSELRNLVEGLKIHK
jgi:hypothetical protein